MCYEGHVRVHVGQAFHGRIQLRAPYVLGAMKDLPLKVRGIDLVEVDEAQRANPSRGEIEREGRAEPSRTHHEHPRVLEAQLPLFADLGQGQMPCVPTEFGGIQLGFFALDQRQVSLPENGLRFPTELHPHAGPGFPRGKDRRGSKAGKLAVTAARDTGSPPAR